MAQKVGEAYLELTAKNNKLKGKLKESEAASKGFISRAGASLRRFGKVAFVGAIAGFAALIAVMIKATKAAAAEQLQTAQLAHQLKRLGLESEIAMREVNALADEQQSLTRYGDTVTRAVLAKMIMLTNNYAGSMKNLSLVFDIAESGLFDVNTAARYVSFAMAGNIEILGRYIAELKTSVTPALKTMTAHQKAAFAIDLLRQKFGGLAKEMGTTTAGAWAKLANAISDAWEALGKGALEEVSRRLGSLTEYVKENEANIERWGESIVKAASALGWLADTWLKIIRGEQPISGWIFEQVGIKGGTRARRDANAALAIQRESAAIITAVIKKQTEIYKEQFKKQADEVKMSAEEQAKWLEKIEEPLDKLELGIISARKAGVSFADVIKKSSAAIKNFGKETKKVVDITKEHVAAEKARIKLLIEEMRLKGENLQADLKALEIEKEALFATAKTQAQIMQVITWAEAKKATIKEKYRLEEERKNNEAARKEIELQKRKTDEINKLIKSAYRWYRKPEITPTALAEMIKVPEIDIEKPMLQIGRIELTTPEGERKEEMKLLGEIKTVLDNILDTREPAIAGGH